MRPESLVAVSLLLGISVPASSFVMMPRRTSYEYRTVGLWEQPSSTPQEQESNLTSVPKRSPVPSRRLGGRRKRRQIVNKEQQKPPQDESTRKTNLPLGMLVSLVAFAIPVFLGLVSWLSFDDTDFYYYESTSITQTTVGPDGRVETTRKESKRTNVNSDGVSRWLREDQEQADDFDDMISFDSVRRMLLEDLDSFY